MGSHRMRTIRLAGPLAALLVVAGAARTQDVRYGRDVRPLLAGHCFKCHGPDLKKGGLDLQSRDGAVQPRGRKGPAVVPGKSADSPLLARVAEKEPSERMPPKGDPLTAEQ